MVRSLCLLVTLAGCVQTAADYDGQPRCGADGFQKFLGQRETVLELIELPPQTRILHPEDAITLDFSPDRLTIDVDKAGFITSVTCR